MLRRIFRFAVICLFTISGQLPAQWVQTNGPSGSAVTCLAVSGANLFAGTDPGGVFLSTDNGSTWSATTLMNTRASVLVVAGQNLFAGTQGDGVYLSTNNGKNWTWASNGLRNTYVTALVLSGTNLFAGTSGGVFLSTDNGTSWTTVNYGLTSTSIQSLGISGAYLFAGLNSGGVFLSSDNGTQWGYSGLTTAVANTFCSSGTKLFAGTNKGVFLSTDNGTRWSSVNAGLTNTAVNMLAVSGTNLFAGTGGGVYLSTNNGAGWAAVNSGVTPGLDTSIYSLVVGGTNIFAGTAHGVRRRPLSEMVTTVEKLSTDLPTHFSLQQNYPNPFNPSTTISFSVRWKSFVSLKVFDALGREVSILAAEELPTGTYSRHWDPALLPSGIYFYRLQAGDFVQTKKSILLK